jgi:hypothetical protein
MEPDDLTDLQRDCDKQQSFNEAHKKIAPPGKPDLAIADRFLQRLDQSAAFFTFQTIDDRRGDLAAEWPDLRWLGGLGPNNPGVFDGSVSEWRDAFESLNRRGTGICVCINETDGNGRRKENIVRVRALVVDLDGSPLKPVLDHHQKPNLVVETSPGRYHAYWFITDCPLEKFTEYQLRLAKKFGGDTNICDLARVMRLPGFYNMKREPFLVRIIYMDGKYV